MLGVGVVWFITLLHFSFQELRPSGLFPFSTNSETISPSDSWWFSVDKEYVHYKSCTDITMQNRAGAQLRLVISQSMLKRCTTFCLFIHGCKKTSCESLQAKYWQIYKQNRILCFQQIQIIFWNVSNTNCLLTFIELISLGLFIIANDRKVIYMKGERTQK